MMNSCRRIGSSGSAYPVQDIREWDALAGEWDDIAAGYATCLFHHCVRNQLLPSVATTTTTPATTTTTTTTATTITSLPQEDSSASTGALTAIGEPRENEIIRIVDFGCGTGLFIERLVEYYCTNDDDDGGHNTVAVQILAMDASSAMIRAVQEKIRNYGWNTDRITVTAIHGIIMPDGMSLPEVQNDIVETNRNHHPNSSIRQLLQELEGTVDLIIASSVLSFIPNDDLPATMMELSKLLKPQYDCGRFLHSDWTVSEFEIPTSEATATAPDEQMHNEHEGDDDVRRTSVPMTKERALAIYQMGIHLKMESIQTVHWKVQNQYSLVQPVLIGVAVRYE
jgi:SAM-dependent methyltransferase